MRQRRVRKQREGSAAVLLLCLPLGLLVGVLWWCAAPGGALYGSGSDPQTWFPRDMILAGLLLLAGAGCALWAIRRQRSSGIRGVSGVSITTLLILLAGGFAGAVIAWRTGVFAGDLLHAAPNDLRSLSELFSLRSGSVLALWPLASAAVVLVYSLVSYSFLPEPAARPVRGPHHGGVELKG